MNWHVMVYTQSIFAKLRASSFSHFLNLLWFLLQMPQTWCSMKLCRCRGQHYLSPNNESQSSEAWRWRTVLKLQSWADEHVKGLPCCESFFAISRFPRSSCSSRPRQVCLAVHQANQAQNKDRQFIGFHAGLQWLPGNKFHLKTMINFCKYWIFKASIKCHLTVSAFTLQHRPYPPLQLSWVTQPPLFKQVTKL